MNKKKLGIAVLAVPVLTAGTVALAASYQSGSDYKPSDVNQELQVNQVVFDKDESGVGHDKKQNKKESQILQKDQKKDTQENGTDNRNQADYLFENNTVSTKTVGVVDQNNNTSGGDKNTDQTAKAQPDDVYKITDDPSKADTELNGTAQNNTGSNDNGSGSDIPGGSDKKGGSKTDESSGNGKGDKESDVPTNSGSDGNKTPATTPAPNPNPNPDPVPTATPKPSIPSSSVRDPDSVKSNPVSGGSGSIEYRPYTENVTPSHNTDANGENISVIIAQSVIRDSYQLYEGLSVTAKNIYDSLTTMVAGKDSRIYFWGDNALDKYVRIDAVSFDGGKTWKSSFPVTIPVGLQKGQMLIKVSYRLSTKSSKWATRQVDYDVSKTRVMLLNTQLQEENQKINSKDILNIDSQYPQIDSMLNLLRYQFQYLGEKRLTKLFPGWMEDGKMLPGFYSVTAGRHVLEPADMVPLDDAYTVKVVFQWMKDNYEVDLVEGNNLVYLQTLTDFDKSAEKVVKGSDESMYRKLTVPKYVQAIVIDEDTDHSVDYISIPDTVFYIKNLDKGLTVRKGYQVSSDNPNYAATKDGILTNKAGTEYLDIPSNMTKLSVPETVHAVHITGDNHLKELKMNAEIMDEIPSVTLDKLQKCKIVIKDGILVSFIEKNYKAFYAETGNSVAGKSTPDITYNVQNDTIISNEGKIRKVLNTGRTSLVLPDSATLLEKDAMSDAGSITTLQMSSNGEITEMEKDCLKNTGVNIIRCYSGRQYEYVKDHLDESGATDNVSVELVGTSAEGYSYSASEINDKETVTLISVPKTVTEFDGTVTAEDGTLINITDIGDNAFESCQSLKWVTLPESVDNIGYQAFYNCSALQGILINNKESITIGNLSLDGCSSLRFVASNAQNGIMKDGYQPKITDRSNQLFFYIPTNASGYCPNCLYFIEGPTSNGVYRFSMEDIGGGNKMLYGLSQDDGSPWLAIRSGSNTSTGEVRLPKTTRELFAYSMLDMTSDTGSYTIDWNSLPELQSVDKGALQDSQLNGTVSLHDVFIGEQALSGTKITRAEILGNQFELSEGVFYSCRRLRSVIFGEFSGEASLYSGIFGECNNLEDVYFTGNNIPELSVYGDAGFRFNFAWTTDQEGKLLYIHVPEGLEEQYVNKWKYSLVGYGYGYTEPRYLTIWEHVQMDLLGKNWAMPEDEEVDQEVRTRVLTAENQVRALLKLDKVSEPMNYYPYRYRNDQITLVGVPSNTEELDLGTIGNYMQLPSGTSVNAVASKTFSGCSKLRKVIIPQSVTQFSENVFAGCSSNKIVLDFQSTTPPELVRTEETGDFSFGTDDSHVEIRVPKGSEETYISAWKSVIGEKRLRSMFGQKVQTDAEGTQDVALFSDGESQPVEDAGNFGEEALEIEETEENTESAIDSGEDQEEIPSDTTEENTEESQEDAEAEEIQAEMGEETEE